MELNEFNQWFIEQVAARWPEWDIESFVLNDWFYSLGSYDEAMLTKAVRDHKVLDDPACRSSKRILERLKAMKMPGKKQYELQIPEKTITADEFWKNVRTNYSWEKRIEIMEHVIKFHKCPKDKDPEAYEWLMKEKQAHVKE